MRTRQLIAVARGFRKGLLGNQPSRGMCFVTSAALAGFLAAHGQETTMWEGEVDKWNHVWLETPDGRVIDATIDQFGSQYPPVYVGKPLEIHTAKRTQYGFP